MSTIELLSELVFKDEEKQVEVQPNYQVGAESLTIGKLFTDDLISTMEKLADEKPYLPSTYFSPSSMQCERQMWFKAKGVKPDKKKSNYIGLGITEVGNARHEAIQKALEKSDLIEWIDIGEYAKKYAPHLEVGEKTDGEYPLRDIENNLSFRCDGLIRFMGELYILEIKTESVKLHEQRNGINKAHLTQGVTYSLALGVNKVMYLYESRDIPRKKAFVLDLNTKQGQEMKDEVQRRIDYVLWAVKENESPKRYQERYSVGACKYCNWKKTCKKY